MCFGGSPAQAPVNRPSTTVDNAYQSVVQSSTPDTSPAPKADTPAPTPLRQQQTGLTFEKQGQ